MAKERAQVIPTIKKVEYVHDPEAAKMWFGLYTEYVKKQIISELELEL